MAEREYCCEALRQLVENWEKPFHWPVFIEQETHHLKANRLAVSLFNLTPSGKGISRQGRSAFFLRYCPVCGTRLDHEQDQA